MNKTKIVSVLALLMQMSFVSCGPTTVSSSSEMPTTSSSVSSEDAIDLSAYYDGYYSNIKSWSNGEDLKEQLHQLISSNINYQKYSGNWAVNTAADVTQTNLDMIDQVYSGDDILIEQNVGSITGGWNREHAFCQSLMGHYVSSSTKKIDLSEVAYQVSSVEIKDGQFYTTYTNGWAGYNTSFETNLGTLSTNGDLIYLGEKDVHDVSLSTIQITDSTLTITEDEVPTSYTIISVQYKYSSEGNGGVASDFHNLFASSNNGNTSRGNKNLGEAGDASGKDYASTSDVFEPGDEDKGRLARALLYMDTCYGDSINLQESLSTIDQIHATGKGAHGNKSTIISWADTYEVNYQEYQHTSVVAKLQGNRNPYVDFPEFIDYVYGSKKTQAGTINDVISSSTQNVLHTNEKNYKNLAFSNGIYEYEVGDSFSSADFKFFNTYTDFSKEEIADRSDISFSIPENYVFTTDDIGTKTVTIARGEEKISYQITVKEYDESKDYEYQYLATTTEFDAKKTTASLEGVDFNVSYTSATSTVKTQKDKLKGVQFGSANNPISNLVIESVNDFVIDSKSSISKINIKASAASKSEATFEVYVGETLVGTYVYGYTSTAYLENDFVCSEPLQGKLKIVVKNDNAKAFYIYSISVDLV